MKAIQEKPVDIGIVDQYFVDELLSMLRTESTFNGSWNKRIDFNTEVTPKIVG